MKKLLTLSLILLCSKFAVAQYYDRDYKAFKIDFSAGYSMIANWLTVAGIGGNVLNAGLNAPSRVGARGTDLRDCIRIGHKHSGVSL